MRHMKCGWALIVVIGMMPSGAMAMAQADTPLTGTRWTLVFAPSAE